MNEERLDAALALIARAGPDPGSVWRHGKGRVYRVITCGIREADLVPVVVYRDEYPDGKLFDGRRALVLTRPLAEFTDGRFALMAPAPKEG